MVPTALVGASLVGASLVGASLVGASLVEPVALPSLAACQAQWPDAGASMAVAPRVLRSRLDGASREQLRTALENATCLLHGLLTGSKITRPDIRTVLAELRTVNGVLAR